MRAEQKRAALVVVRKVWLNFNTAGFRVDPNGKHWALLKDAERLGLVRWVGDDRCGLTDAGVSAAAEYVGGGD